MAGTTAVSVALVGAASLLGEEIKEQLAATGFPEGAVALLDVEELAGMLTQYGDEARVVTEAAFDEMLQHDLVCFCGRPAFAAEQLQPLLRAGRVGLDCTGAWAHAPESYLWLPGTNPEPTFAAHAAIALPTGATQLIAVAVATLGDLAEGAVATVLVPASEEGDRGLKELSQQSIAVLNLDVLDDAVFGRQRAFDLWPQPADEGAAAAAALADEIDRLGLCAPALSVLAAPVFHGVAASMYLPTADPEAVRAALSKAFPLAPSTTGAKGEIDSPVRVSGRPGIHVGAILPDRRGSSWVWLIADNLNARAAAAVAAINTLLRPGLAAPLGLV